MDTSELLDILKKQKKFFHSSKTLDLKVRKCALERLKESILKYESEISDALRADLKKSKSESYMTEIGVLLSEISYMQKHIGKFSKDKRVRTPMAQFCAKSFIKPSPYGCVLIISPWNYPLLLSLGPLIDAISAGNTAVIKLSAYSPNVSDVIEKVITNAFSEEYVKVIKGGREENQALLDMDFDYIFFTGSKEVGKLVQRSAAERLIPVTLELGGKSPCIVDKSANIKLSAKRIVFGKIMNSGQTCVAPDYVYCHKDIKDELVCEIKKQIQLQTGDNPLKNDEYGKIVNKKHFERIIGLIDDEKVVFGGEYDTSSLKIVPTVIDNVTWEDKVMAEEIFGPLLPILTYEKIDDVIQKLHSLPSPLAAYIFASDKNTIKKLCDTLSFGGGCINDTIIHLATSYMGFGGVGESGMGAYHGKAGFDTFTHYKSIVDKKTFIDLPMRYRPYSEKKDKIIRMFLK